MFIKPNMICHDLSRRICLCLTAIVFFAIAVRAILAPEKMAHGLGYVLSNQNSYSEFYAIYFGVWIATGGLALLAAIRVRQVLLGDLVAMFVLAQPVGRGWALLQYGPPEGTLLVLSMVELIGGLILLLVRPSA